MAGENFNARAQFEIDVDKAVRDVNQLTSTIARLGDTAEGKTAQQLSRMEKQTVNMASALKGMTGQTTAAAAAQDKVANSVSKATGSLSNQRYALYDVATTWGVVSAATLGAAGAAAKIAIDYEAAFAQVQRTSGLSGQALADLRTELVDLSTQLPESFANISEIATLGGQLGVPQQALDDFTATVARFGATTDVTTNAAATALGRIASLTDAYTNDGTASYNKLGSAILKTGVNANATESGIISIAQEIATSGDLAGFSADEIIGLASALDSIKVPAERARGTVQRVFSTISTAVSTGGADLDKFAQLTGRSAEDFAETWRTEPVEALRAFLGGINQVAASGQDVKTFLSNTFGISAVRDADTIARLANNLDILDTALADTASGYADGTELANQYGIIAETTAARLTILANTLKAIVDAVGQGGLGPFGELLDLVQGLAEAFLTIARNPVGQFFLGLAGAIGVAVGVLAAYRAAQALTLASLFAMKQAQDSLSGAVTKGNGSLVGLTRTMAVMAIGTQRATAAQTAYNASLQAGSGRFTALVAGAKGAATAVNGVGTAVKGAFVSSGIGLAITGLLSAVTLFAQGQEEARARAEELRGTLDAQTGAVTELTRANVAAKLEQDGVLSSAQTLGLSLETVTSAALGQASAVQEVADAITAARLASDEGARGNSEYNAEIVRTVDAADTLERRLNFQRNALEEGKASWDRVKEATGAAGATAEDTADQIDMSTNSLSDLANNAFGAVDNTVAVQNALFQLGQSLYDNGAAFDAYSTAGRENLGALSGVISAMVKAAGDDSVALATMLQGLIGSLSSYGVNAATSLQPVLNLINQLTGGKGTAGLNLDAVTQAANESGNALRQGFSGGAAKAAKQAAKTRKEVKTLSDYVRDLGSVFSDAFDFRFGLDKSIDGVADAFQQIVDSAADAQEAVADATQAIIESDAKIKGLNAANNTLSYQLTVAKNYGDALRATEIIAEMAQNNADLRDEQKARAKSEKDLQKAQNATAKSLDGTTVESREQREQVLGLVQAYQEQVTALANQGLSQAEVARRTQDLKNQFIAQLTQMGYNRAEVDRYAAAFDDLTYSILNVPRNITVSANTEPAQRALNEFLARANSSSATASLSASGGGVYNASGINVGSGGIYSPELRTDGVFSKGSLGNSTGLYNRVASTGGLIKPIYRAGGGSAIAGMSTGPKGTDRIPAWLTDGEYVQRRAAVDYYGLPFMNAINNMQMPRYLATGGPVTPTRAPGGSGTQIVELSALDRALLAAAGNVTIELDGKVVAASVNRANGGGVSRGSM